MPRFPSDKGKSVCPTFAKAGDEVVAREYACDEKGATGLGRVSACSPVAEAVVFRDTELT